MTLQMSRTALLANGYKIVGYYKMWEQDGYNKHWNLEEAYCYQKGNECLVRLVNNRRTFTLVYNNKKDANEKIKQLIKMGYRKAN